MRKWEVYFGLWTTNFMITPWMTLFLELNVNDFDGFCPNNSQQFWIIVIMHEGIWCGTKNWSSWDFAFTGMETIASVNYYYIDAVCFEIIQLQLFFNQILS